jgi:hypothetical protein
MTDEPLRHRRFMLLLAFCAVASAPFPFAGRPLRLLGGLPLWLWWSLIFTSALAFLCCVALLRYWKDDARD